MQFASHQALAQLSRGKQPTRESNVYKIPQGTCMRAACGHVLPPSHALACIRWWQPVVMPSVYDVCVMLEHGAFYRQRFHKTVTAAKYAHHKYHISL